MHVCVRCVCVLLFAFVCFSVTQFQKFRRWELKLDATLLDIMGLQAEIGLILLTKTNVRLNSFNKIELLRILFKLSLRMVRSHANGREVGQKEDQNFGRVVCNNLMNRSDQL